jgi:hypothetical protein
MSTEIVISNTNVTEKNRIQKIIQLHSEIARLYRMSVENAAQIGQLLIEQKESMEHGEWGSWVENNLPFTIRTAQNYMCLSRRRKKLKNENVSSLSFAYSKIIMERKEREKPDWDERCKAPIHLRPENETERKISLSMEGQEDDGFIWEIRVGPNKAGFDLKENIEKLRPRISD